MYDPLDVVILGAVRTVVPFFIGWLVFRFIANKTYPFKKPTKIEKRPRWFLAFWIGLMIVVVLSTPLINIEKSDVLGQVVLKSVFFILFIIPGLIGYWMYKRKVKKAIINRSS